MIITTTYRENNPTTTTGYSIEVKTTYSTHNKEEYDKLADMIDKNIGSGHCIDTDKKE